MFSLSKILNVDDAILYFGSNLNLLLDFKKTPQDKDWHAEGNVHIHTDMVLSEIYSIIENEAKHLSDKDKEILVWSALLHDICKPISTKEIEKNGLLRIGSKNHEILGRNYLFYKLRDYIDDPYQFNQIVNLVGLHNIPKLLVIKDQPKNLYYKLSREVRMDLIYYLELADMRGRICSDRSYQLDLIEIFKLNCEEYNIFNNNDAYKEQRNFIFNELKNENNLTKNFVFNSFCYNFELNKIFCPEEEISKSHNYRENFSHFLLTCGLSGIGKSSYIKEKYPNYEIISLDNLRLEHLGNTQNFKYERKIRDLANKQLKKHLASKKNVIWDATNYRKDFRSTPLSLGFNYNAYTEILLFNKKIQDTLNQNSKRNKNIVDDKIIKKQIRKFQYPEISEAHSIKFIFD